MQTEFAMSERPTSPPTMTPSAIQPMRVRQRPKTLDYTPAETIKLIDKSIRIPPENSVSLTITPAVAEHMLEFNLHNRTKKPSKIALYAADMKKKDWRETAEAIKFSDAGYLRDGQNRLYACILAQTSFETSVVFGLPDNSFSKMDQGKNRSGGDLLTIAGYTDTNNLAAAIRWAYLFDHGRVKQRDTLTPDETLELARTQYCVSEEGRPCPDLTDFVKIAGRIYQTSGQPKGMMAALLYTINKMNPAKQSDWAHAWENGIDGGKYRAIGMATKKIGEMKTVGGRVHDVVRAALLVKAWNMFVLGSRGRKEDMIWSNEDDFPEIASGLTG